MKKIKKEKSIDVMNMTQQLQNLKKSLEKVNSFILKTKVQEIERILDEKTKG